MLSSISVTAHNLGVSIPTLRRWDKSGRLTPDWRTPGNHRRYNLARLFGLEPTIDRQTVCYTPGFPVTTSELTCSASHCA